MSNYKSPEFWEQVSAHLGKQVSVVDIDPNTFTSGEERGARASLRVGESEYLLQMTIHNTAKGTAEVLQGLEAAFDEMDNQHG